MKRIIFICFFSLLKLGSPLRAEANYSECDAYFALSAKTIDAIHSPKDQQVFSFRLGGREHTISMNDAREIVAGRRTLHAYSGFGSSYGRTLDEQLSQFLETGAYLSLVQRKLIERLLKIKPDSSLITKTVMEVFSPKYLLDPTKAQAHAFRLLKDKEMARTIGAEVKAAADRVIRFKGKASDITDRLKAIHAYFDKNRNLASFRLSARKVKDFEKEPEFEELFKMREDDLHVLWGEARTEYDSTRLRELDAKLREKYLKINPVATESDWLVFKNRTDASIIFRYFRKWHLFYKERDWLFTWYASGSNWLTRESFNSIQKFFAKDGLIFEFKPEALSRIEWGENLPNWMLQWMPNDGLMRDGLSYDLVSLGGMRIPEDLSRVYVSSEKDVAKVVSLFEGRLGKNVLDDSGITFHTLNEQNKIYSAEMSQFMEQAKRSGIFSSEPIFPFRSRDKYYFLSREEAADVKAGRRSLHSYLHLEGDQAKDDLVSLIRQSALLRDKVAAGRSNPKPLDSDFKKTSVFSLEFRPDVPEREVKDALESGKNFDLRWLSRIYADNPEDLEFLKEEFNASLNEGLVHRWNLSFHLKSEQEEILAGAKELRLLERSDARPSLANQARPAGVSTEPRKIDLRLPRIRRAVLDRLLSNDNFGVPHSLTLRKILKAEEYSAWIELQNFVVDAAARRVPLDRKLVDRIFLLASTATDKSKYANPGYRIAPEDNLWTLAVDQGDLWNFERTEAIHYFKLPYFEVQGPAFRTSSTTIALPEIKFAKPGPGIEEEIDELIKLYHSQPNADPIDRIALFQRDLVALHPNTDGNGRATRAIMHFLLLREQYAPAIMGNINSLDWHMAPAEYADRVRALADSEAKRLPGLTTPEQ